MDSWRAVMNKKNILILLLVLALIASVVVRSDFIFKTGFHIDVGILPTKSTIIPPISTLLPTGDIKANSLENLSVRY